MNNQELFDLHLESKLPVLTVDGSSRLLNRQDFDLFSNIVRHVDCYIPLKINNALYYKSCGLYKAGQILSNYELIATICKPFFEVEELFSECFAYFKIGKGEEWPINLQQALKIKAANNHPDQRVARSLMRAYLLDQPDIVDCNVQTVKRIVGDFLFNHTHLKGQDKPCFDALDRVTTQCKRANGEYCQASKFILELMLEYDYS